MWTYEKRLQYPVSIKSRDMKMAKLMFAQYGGADSELSAGLRYLTQRYSMPLDTLKALLTDIGTEELAHWEMIGAMIQQLTAGASAEEYRAAGLGDYYVAHQNGIYPQDASGIAYTATYVQAKGDPVADLTEDMAAERTYTIANIFAKTQYSSGF